MNLALAVGPPDGAGYHPIASWMVPLAFGDEVEIERSSDGLSRFTIAFADDAPLPQQVDWPVEADLTYRAHRLVEREAGRVLPVTVHVRKRVPAGAGLGGGSSDAAAMLSGLVDCFELGVSDARLLELGAELGADVAFLAYVMRGGSAALATGFGERLSPLPLRGPLHLALILPEARCGTGAVYGAFDKARPEPPIPEAGRIEALAGHWPLRDALLFNDLAEAALCVEPRLAGMRERAADAAGRAVHVTGSGAAMFVIADSASHAQALADRIREAASVRCIATAALGGE